MQAVALKAGRRSTMTECAIPCEPRLWFLSSLSIYHNHVHVHVRGGDRVGVWFGFVRFALLLAAATVSNAGLLVVLVSGCC